MIIMNNNKLFIFDIYIYIFFSITITRLIGGRVHIAVPWPEPTDVGSPTE